jgi:hypothetical protein
MNQFQHRTEFDGGGAFIATELRRQQVHGRAQPLASPGLEVTGDLGHWLEPEARLSRQLPFHLVQVSPDQVEDLSRG